MPDPPSHLAARLAHDTRCSLSAAGRQHGVTREAVRQAYARLYPCELTPHGPGAPGAGRSRRTRQISVRDPSTRRRVANIALTTTELGLLRAGADQLGVAIGPWLWSLLATLPVPAGTDLAAHLREIGVEAARKLADPR